MQERIISEAGGPHYGFEDHGADGLPRGYRPPRPPARKDQMARFPVVLLLAGLLLGAAPAADPAADPGEAPLAAMRVQEQRIATIAWRLASANLDLCRRREWLPGFAAHDLSQYGARLRPAAIRLFGLDRGPGVLVLAAGGPAEAAGLRRDDILLALDGRPPPAPRRRDAGAAGPLADAIEAAFADGVADLRILRGAERFDLRIAARQGCASRFQMIDGGGRDARADGRYVQVTTALMLYAADDAELAAVLAHEFAHNILGHRDRLDAAGAARGFFGGFGRSAGMIRETEAEADRLSVYLLERAGYDPEAAIRFWQRFGHAGLNILGDPTHPNWRARIQSFETEIARIRADRAAGRVPRPDFLPAA